MAEIDIALEHANDMCNNIHNYLTMLAKSLDQPFGNVQARQDWLMTKLTDMIKTMQQIDETIEELDTFDVPPHIQNVFNSMLSDMNTMRKSLTNYRKIIELSLTSPSIYLPQVTSHIEV